MVALADRIDRFARNARNIADVASAVAPDAPAAGPFTRAILSTDLGDLIRDIDPTELGLFSLLPPSGPAPTPSEPKDIVGSRITRVNFVGATPLRKQPAPRGDGKSKETEPEIYAHAALRCIVRYQSIRPMTRAYSEVMRILEDLKSTRENIHRLSNTLQQSQLAEAPSLKGAAEEKEKRVAKLQARLQELEKRKAASLEKQLTGGSAKTEPNADSFSSPPLGSKALEPQSWNTPAAAARTFQLDESLLMDEVVDVGDVSIMSAPPEEASALDASSSFEDSLDKTVRPSDLVDEADANDSTEAPPADKGSHPEGAPLSSTAAHTQAQEDMNWEVDRIVNKIWATMGDVLFPGTGARPSTKDAVTLLRLISDAPRETDPAPGSYPSQQVLTAYLLTSLLSATPNFSLQLNRLKSLLAEKAGVGTDGSLVGVRATTRVIYGCVAKRLLKINRGGGEQIVTFDV